MVDFGAALKKWRMQHNLKQWEAAEFLDVPQRTYEQWEQGRQMPSQNGPILKLMATFKATTKKK